LPIVQAPLLFNRDRIELDHFCEHGIVAHRGDGEAVVRRLATACRFRNRSPIFRPPAAASERLIAGDLGAPHDTAVAPVVIARRPMQRLGRGDGDERFTEQPVFR
jgi:hypothetical protein